MSRAPESRYTTHRIALSQNGIRPGKGQRPPSGRVIPYGADIRVNTFIFLRQRLATCPTSDTFSDLNLA